MPCFLSCKSKSVLAKPLEHQCSRATMSPTCGANSLRISPPQVPYSKVLCAQAAFWMGAAQGGVRCDADVVEERDTGGKPAVAVLCGGVSSGVVGAGRAAADGASRGGEPGAVSGRA